MKIENIELIKVSKKQSIEKFCILLELNFLIDGRYEISVRHKYNPDNINLLYDSIHEAIDEYYDLSIPNNINEYKSIDGVDYLSFVRDVVEENSFIENINFYCDSECLTDNISLPVNPHYLLLCQLKNIENNLFNLDGALDFFKLCMYKDMIIDKNLNLTKKGERMVDLLSNNCIKKWFPCAEEFDISEVTNRYKEKHPYPINICEKNHKSINSLINEMPYHFKEKIPESINLTKVIKMLYMYAVAIKKSSGEADYFKLGIFANVAPEEIALMLQGMYSVINAINDTSQTYFFNRCKINDCNDMNIIDSLLDSFYIP